MPFLANLLPLLGKFLTNPAVWKWIGILCIAAALFIGGCRHGAGEVQADWEEAKLENAAAVAKLKGEQEAITNALILDYNQQIARIQQTTKIITKKVKIYVPADSCPLPPGFRVLHNAAVRNQLPDPAGEPNVTTKAPGSDRR